MQGACGQQLAPLGTACRQRVGEQLPALPGSQARSSLGRRLASPLGHGTCGV